MIVGMEVVSGYRPSPSGSFAHAPELKARGQGHVILAPPGCKGSREHEEKKLVNDRYYIYNNDVE